MEPAVKNLLIVLGLTVAAVIVVKKLGDWTAAKIDDATKKAG